MYPIVFVFSTWVYNRIIYVIIKEKPLMKTNIFIWASRRYLFHMTRWMTKSLTQNKVALWNTFIVKYGSCWMNHWVGNGAEFGKCDLNHSVPRGCMMNVLPLDAVFWETTAIFRAYHKLLNFAQFSYRLMLHGTKTVGLRIGTIQSPYVWVKIKRVWRESICPKRIHGECNPQKCIAPRCVLRGNNRNICGLSETVWQRYVFLSKQNKYGLV